MEEWNTYAKKQNKTKACMELKAEKMITLDVFPPESCSLYFASEPRNFIPKSCLWYQVAIIPSNSVIEMFAYPRT